MNKTKLKINVTNVARQHVRLTVFMGNEGGDLASCGELTMPHTEYQLFASALMIAASGAMVTMTQHLIVEVEEDKWIEFHKINSND